MPGSATLVLFDVGNVLFHLRPWREVFAAIDGGDDARGVDLEVAVQRFVESETFASFERGHSSVEEFCDAVRGHFSLDLNDAAIRDAYLRLLGPPVAGMREIVVELKRRGIRVCGLSDTSPIHLEAFESYPVMAELERVVTSCETGCLKPTREAFEKALDLLGAEASETVFVDDRAANVQGALAVGMRGVIFEGAATLRNTLGLGEN